MKNSMDYCLENSAKKQAARPGRQTSLDCSTTELHRVNTICPEFKRSNIISLEVG